MVLQTSGSISCSQILAEYGVAGPFSFGATGRALDRRIPQAATVLMSNFLGKYFYATSGLQLWLDSRESASYSGTGSTWYDMSGNNRNFAITGTFTYEAAVKRFYSQLATLTGPSSDVWGINQDHTLEIICQPTTTTDSTTFTHFQATDGTRMILNHLHWSNGNIYYDVRGCCDGTQRVNYAYTNGTNLKHYIFRTRTSATPHRQVFENTVSQIDSGTNTTSAGFTWGGPSYFLTGTWTGYCHLIRLYNRALTDAEITKNYNAVKAIYSI